MGENVLLEQKVGEIVCRLANLASVAPEQDYFDAGLASVQALELLIELETTFGVAISDDEFAEVRTVRNLARLIEGQGGKA